MNHLRSVQSAMTTPSTDTSLPISRDLIRKYDRSGPRYTSYPTADRFIEACNADSVKQWLDARKIGGYLRPLSLYAHIPFCTSICYYCACNKIITKDRSHAAKYLRYLEREILMQHKMTISDDSVGQMHWGGGTPTFLKLHEMQQLMNILRERFNFTDDCESSIEVDPRTVDPAVIHGLRELGFNRMSIGVQDFSPEVQLAVNRKQTKAETLLTLHSARRAGFRSISMDLIYGLPKQTAAGFSHTLDEVVDARPDRIALYNFAYLPKLFKAQRRINEADLPSPEVKLTLLMLAIQRFTAAGYEYIGMDHFALPDDDLCVAQRQGRLHRNFQGYSTHGDTDLLSFGVSAIGAIGPNYYQNFRTLDEYYDSLDRGVLPVMRGLELDPDDLMRRAIIQSLMCNFNLSMEAIEVAYLIDFKKYFATELADLKAFETDGLARIDEDTITVTESGRFLVRHICMVFDRYLRIQAQRSHYSKVI
jgi:oxygen-independent coproporphyrinogen III oxidase